MVGFCLKFKLSDEQLHQVEAAVKKAESKTSGEIVPVIARSSSDYLWVPLIWALGLSGVATFSEFVLRYYDGFPASAHKLLFLQWGGMAVGFLIGTFTGIKRLTIPKVWKSFCVQRAAHARFILSGCTETRDRTGVLIYLSLLERQVVIVADKGIYAHAPQEFWQQQADSISKGAREGRPAQFLIAVIDSIALKLHEHFPRRTDDTNELADAPHTE